jgi:hypothetical protein
MVRTILALRPDQKAIHVVGAGLAGVGVGDAGGDREPDAVDEGNTLVDRNCDGCVRGVRGNRDGEQRRVRPSGWRGGLVVELQEPRRCVGVAGNDAMHRAGRTLDERVIDRARRALDAQNAMVAVVSTGTNTRISRNRLRYAHGESPLNP